MNHPFLKKIQNKYNSSKNDYTKNIEENTTSSDKKEICLNNSTFIEENYLMQHPDSTLEKTLTYEENLLMQLSLEKQKTHALVLDKLTILLQSKKLIIQNYEMRIKQINDEINIITEQIKQNQDTLKNVKEEHIELVNKLSNKYALSSGWKFDLETGKIT